MGIHECQEPIRRRGDIALRGPSSCGSAPIKRADGRRWEQMPQRAAHIGTPFRVGLTWSLEGRVVGVRFNLRMTLPLMLDR